MLIRLVVYLILFYVIYRIIKIFRQEKMLDAKARQSQQPVVNGEELIEDPNCHIYIPVSQSYKKEISGKKHYFCSKECFEKYISGNNK